MKQPLKSGRWRERGYSNGHQDGREGTEDIALHLSNNLL
jgi:hypothetical protein